MLADRALTQTNPLLAVVGQLLRSRAVGSRAAAVLDLLSSDPVRRRFGFTEKDLETVADWVENAGIRWSFDQRTVLLRPGGLRPEHLAVRSRPDPGRGRESRTTPSASSARTLPLDDVASSDIDLAGRLAEAIDRLRRTPTRLVGEHPVNHWLDTIGAGVDELTSVGRSDEWQRGSCAVSSLRSRRIAAAGRTCGCAWPTCAPCSAERLAGRPTRANFRTGTLTVCTMTPMRSVPHRVVCLLGLDDGVFPRAGAVDGDDVLARRPLTGERDLRSEDRQLMLDAIMAARQTLVVTYTGADETTGLPRPPAVPLRELMDALAVTATDADVRVLTGAPVASLRPPQPRPGRLGPFSFDEPSLAGARAAAAPRLRRLPGSATSCSAATRRTSSWRS